VVNHYAGGHPITRPAVFIAAGALVMALIYAWDRCPHCTSNPRWPSPSTAAECSRWAGSCPAGSRNSLAPSAARCSCRPCSPMSPRAGPTRFPRQAGLAGVHYGDCADGNSGERDPAHRDRAPQPRPQRRHRAGSTVALLGLFASPISGSSISPARTLGPDAERTAAEGGGLRNDEPGADRTFHWPCPPRGRRDRRHRPGGGAVPVRGFVVAGRPVRELPEDGMALGASWRGGSVGRSADGHAYRQAQMPPGAARSLQQTDMRTVQVAPAASRGEAVIPCVPTSFPAAPSLIMRCLTTPALSAR
jgi:hypothetical protein